MMGIYILHMIDAWSKFSVATFIKRKLPQVIANEFCLKWLGAVYGTCNQVNFDNSGEFSMRKYESLRVISE